VVVERGTVAVVRTWRKPGAQWPSFAVAVPSPDPFGQGYKFVHLTEPRFYVNKRGLPAWAHESVRRLTRALAVEGLSLERCAAIAAKGAT